MLKKLFLLLILLLSISLIANEKGDKKMESILENKPSFTIRMESQYANFIVTLNGVTVYNGTDGTPITLEMPVNHLITSGDNELKVQLLAWDDTNYKLHKDLLCKVSLRVKKFGEFDKKPITISKIIYDNKKENPLSDSTQKGAYSSINNFKLDKNGDVIVSDIKQKKLTSYQWDKVEGVMLSQIINLKTPFPRWKFLDSEKIINTRFDELTKNEYYTLRQRADIKELYKAYKRIYDALEKKDVDSIIDLFDERNKEMDIAMYHNKPYYKKRLYEALKKDVNDNNRELLKWNESEMYFFIEENGKLIYIDGAITFNDKDGSTNTSYPILFRKENGKWIISR